MSNWQRELDISKAWKKCENNNSVFRELAKDIVFKLRLLTPFENRIDNEKEDIIIEFEEIIKCSECTIEDFDTIMEDLYDWGDTQLDNEWPPAKVCWINTFERTNLLTRKRGDKK